MKEEAPPEAGLHNSSGGKFFIGSGFIAGGLILGGCSEKSYREAKAIARQS
jgi:hypothetical protein